MKRRGYRPSFNGIQREDFPDIPDAWWRDWEPDAAAMYLNRARIAARSPSS